MSLRSRSFSNMLRSGLMLTAAMSLSYVAHAAAADAPFQPDSNWAVSKIAASKTAGGGAYCALARRYTNGTVLTLARNGRDESSMAIDFQKNAVLDKDANYSVTLKPGTGQQRTFNVHPVSGRALVVRLGKDYAFYDALNRAGELDVQIGADSYGFSMADFETGQQQMNGCLASMTEPAAGGGDTQTAQAATPAAVPAAPVKLADAGDSIPPLPLKKNIVSEKAASDGGTQLESLREENSKLKAALEKSRRTYENQAVRSDKDSGMAAELSEKIGILQQENDALKQQAANAAPQGSTPDSVKALKDENTKLKAQINELSANAGSAEAEEKLAQDGSLKAQEADKKLAEANAKIAEADKKLAEADRKLADSAQKTSATTDADQKLAEAGQKLDLANKKMVDADQRLSQADQKLAEASQRAAQLNDTLTAHNAQQNDADKKLADAAAKLDEANRKLADADKRLADASQKTASQSQQQADAGQKLTLANQKLVEATAKLAEAQAKVAAADQKNTANDQKLALANQKLQEATQKFQTAQMQVAQAAPKSGAPAVNDDQKMTLAAQKLAEADRRAAEADQKAAAAEQKLRDVQTKLAQADQKIVIAGSHAVMAKAVPPSKEQQEIIASLQTQLQALESENAGLKQAAQVAQIQPAAGAMQTAAANDGSAAQQLRALQDQVNQVTSERDRFKHEIDAAQTGTEDHLMKISSADWNLEESTRRFNEAERQIRTLGRQVEESKTQCEAEKKKVEAQLFDPAIATKQQIAQVAALQDSADRAKADLQTANTRIADLEKQVKTPASVVAAAAPVTPLPVQTAVMPLLKTDSVKTEPVQAKALAALAPASGPADAAQDSTGYSGQPAPVQAASITPPEMPAPQPQLASAAQLQSFIGRGENVKNVQKSGDTSYSWRSGSLFGSAEQTPVSGKLAFGSQVTAYLAKAKSRCAGTFAAKPGPVQDENGIHASAYELACVGGAQSAAASVLFYSEKGLFTTIAHEGSLDEMGTAMDVRDKLMGKLLQTKLASN